MKFLALSILVSLILTGLFTWKKEHNNVRFWVVICVNLAAGVLFSILFRWLYPSGLYHKSNLLGWGCMLVILIHFLTDVVLNIRTGKELWTTGSRVLVSVALWYLLCYVFGSKQVRQFPKKADDQSADIVLMGLLALHGMFSLAWAGLSPLLKRFPEKLHRFFRILFFVLTPVFMVILCETAQGTALDGVDWLPITVDIAICALICYAVFLILPGRAQPWAAWALMMIAFLLGCTCQFLTDFRDMPLMANDLYSITTAMTVAGGYVYQFSAGILKAVEFFFFILIFGDWCLRRPGYLQADGGIVPEDVPSDSKQKYRRLQRYMLRLAGAVCCLVILCFWVTKVDFIQNYTGEIDSWRPGKTYKRAGFASSFIASWQLLQVKKPEGYSPKRAEEILENASSKDSSDGSGLEATASQSPSVIVVMNESFSDFSAVCPLECTKDHLKFFYSMKDDPGTLQYGYDYVSTLGGGTARSEWEFLTGMTTAFLPGRVAYTQMDLTGVPSLATVFRQQGYRTVAMHPNEATNYRRNTVYPALGFDRFLSEDDYGDMEKVRGYCSDLYDYQKVLEVLEEEEDPAFIFNVTMQNHGGYIKNPLTINVDEGLEGYQEFVTYEAVLKLSDDALEYLIKELKECDRPVILCFFGDHLPGVGNDLMASFQEKGRKADATAVDIGQELLRVPYLIWANYPVETDIEPTEVDGYDITSPGMMGAMTAAYAGSKKTNYLSWMLETRKQVPVINCVGYYGSDAVWHSFGEGTADSETLADMEIVQYNALVDRKNRVEKEYNLEQTEEESS